MSSNEQDRLERYLWEAEATFEELEEHLDAELEAHLEQSASKIWQKRAAEILQPPKYVFVFLQEHPEAQQRRLAKMSLEDRALLWLQARVWAYEATIELQTNKNAAMVIGMGYRKAVRRMAEAAQPMLVLPPLEDVLSPSLLNY